MKDLPSPPKNWEKQSPVDPSELIALLKKATANYYYWDKFKMQPMPKGIDSRKAWTTLKLYRKPQMTPTPFKDVEGTPFCYSLPEHLSIWLQKIDRILIAKHERPDTLKYMLRTLLEEAITSSQIEGALTTMKEAKQMLLSHRKPRDHSEQMIYNNYLTMQSLKEWKEKPLSPELIFNIHTMITDSTLFQDDYYGRYRNANEDVGVYDHYENLLFNPPPSKEVPKRIKELCVFANKKDSIHPIIKAIILHFLMAYIHPFIDGNGRTARALFYWYLLRNNYWLFEYVSISKQIVQKPAQYSKAYLYTEKDECDLTYFLHFNLKVIISAIDDFYEFLSSQKNLVKETLEYPHLNQRQIDLLLHLKAYPHELITIKYHQTQTGTVYQTARTDLLDLVKQGHLKKIQKGKTFYFLLSGAKNP